MRFRARPCLWQGIPRVCATLRLCFANPGDFTVRFCARPCLWQGSCVSSPRCEFAPQTRGFYCALLRTSLPVAVDRKGRGACVFACKNTGGLCRSPGEPGFCAALRNKKPPGLFFSALLCVFYVIL